MSSHTTTEREMKQDTECIPEGGEALAVKPVKASSPGKNSSKNGARTAATKTASVKPGSGNGRGADATTSGEQRVKAKADIDNPATVNDISETDTLRAENDSLRALLEAQAVELSEARAESLHAMELKSQFMANISHELRTPLSGVLGMAELLKEMPLTPDQEELVSYIYVSAAGLVDVVNSLLDFSRLASGKLRIEKSKFSARKLLDDTQNMYRELAHRKGLHIECSIDDDVPAVLVGDELRIRQVISGLTNNAIKFSEQGVIKISAEKVKQFDEMVVVRFSVSDSGIGVPVSEQERVFMPFVQVDGSSTRRYGGVGLGLPICKLLVQLMSGSMSLTSSSGKGSTFSFSLPLEVKD